MMTGRPNAWAACRSADLVASSWRVRWCASSSGLRMLTAQQTRRLGTTAPRATDGVFRGLTDGRLPTPWIEAFRKQQADKATTAREARPQERDLSPRRMSDSYHRVVLPLGQDPWLSDTYINSSGHIRCVRPYAGGRSCLCPSAGFLTRLLSGWGPSSWIWTPVSCPGRPVSASR